MTIPAQPGRLLWFAGELVGIRLEISGEGASRTLVGRLVPALSARVEIRHRDHVTTVATDPRGHFRAVDVPAGSVDLRCHIDMPAQPRALVTPWLKAMYQDLRSRSL